MEPARGTFVSIMARATTHKVRPSAGSFELKRPNEVCYRWLSPDASLKHDESDAGTGRRLLGGFVEAGPIRPVDVHPQHRTVDRAGTDRTHAIQSN
jgi:hypothetical protein